LGLSQRDLGAIMSVPRTYVSKVETGNATPNLPGLEKLARALEVTVAELVGGGERTKQDEIRELMKDQFVVELMPFLARLSLSQRRTVLAETCSMAERRRAGRSSLNGHQGSSARSGPVRTPSETAWLASLGLASSKNSASVA
jgi:transcriptional regulator with XRE-family HTH domain